MFEGRNADDLQAWLGSQPADSVSAIEVVSVDPHEGYRSGVCQILCVTGRDGHWFDGVVPATGVDAVVWNVTAVDTLAPGFATVFPCGEAIPVASNLNYAAGATIPNAVIAKVGAGGKTCIYTWEAIHLLVDVNIYVPSP